MSHEKNVFFSIPFDRSKINDHLSFLRTCAGLVSVKQESTYRKWIPHQVRNDKIDPKRIIETEMTESFAKKKHITN